MRWSKLRQLVRQGFADCLQGRLDIHSTRYGASSAGHAWLTWDNVVIANFCTRASRRTTRGVPPSPRQNKMYELQLADYGEFSREDAHAACWALVHDLSIDDALADTDPLVQSLAVVDRRTGKRRLATLDRARLHPLAAKLMDVRIHAEVSNDD